VRVAFLGLGLIGGSIVRALRNASPDRIGDFDSATLVAWTPSGAGPSAASVAGLLDVVAGSVEEAVADADLVILAAPPLEALSLLGHLAGLGDRTLITDVTSTKAAVVERAGSLGLRFVGGHPLAGRETRGFESSEPGLFAGRPWVITTDHADDGDIGRVEALATACGAIPIRMSAAAHDQAVAGISHLPLVLAAALVEAVAGRSAALAPSDWGTAGTLAASGWRDMTRLARGDIEMGAGIAATNAGPLAARIRDVRYILDAWLAELDRPGGPELGSLRARLRDARARLEDAP
jgi:prephenate dehydrogenase